MGEGRGDLGAAGYTALTGEAPGSRSRYPARIPGTPVDTATLALVLRACCFLELVVAVSLLFLGLITLKVSSPYSAQEG